MASSRNLLLLAAGLAIAALTLLVSWRLGFVFFLLPLFFFWSWGGSGRRLKDPAEDLRAEERGDGGPGERGRSGRAPRDREGSDDGRRARDEPPGPGIDGEGI